MVEGFRTGFTTVEGYPVPAVTATQMRELDRVAVEDYGLGLLQMLENAGRSLAALAMELVGDRARDFVVLAGGGGNGGGGLCCARHLLNHSNRVSVVLDRESAQLTGAARRQFDVLSSHGLAPTCGQDIASVLDRATLVVDALIGYGLRGAPHGRAARLINACNRRAADVLSLDVPSGLNSTSGSAPGAIVRSDATLTLALPKIGLAVTTDDLYLADLGIPPSAYRRIGVAYKSPFSDEFRVRVLRRPQGHEIC